MAVYPLRIVFMKVPKPEAEETKKTISFDTKAPVSILISVPKKRFHHAVDRNRMKRLVREAYRTQKHSLWEALADKDYTLAIGFVCICDQLQPYRIVRKSINKAITRIIEKL